MFYGAQSANLASEKRSQTRLLLMPPKFQRLNLPKNCALLPGTQITKHEGWFSGYFIRMAHSWESKAWKRMHSCSSGLHAEGWKCSLMPFLWLLRIPNSATDCQNWLCTLRTSCSLFLLKTNNTICMARIFLGNIFLQFSPSNTIFSVIKGLILSQC